MDKEILTEKDLEDFREHLILEEKSAATVEKYMRDAKRFLAFMGERTVTKAQAIAYKEALVKSGYASASINSMLSAVNSLFTFLNRRDCCVRYIKTQRQLYCAEERELSKAEYMQLLKASESNPRLHMLLQTICATGIRVSELAYFTVEAVRNRRVVVSCKNKQRIILVPGKLRKALLCYCRKAGIKSGVIFRTKTGKPLDRSNIWSEMKRLCRKARVSPSKVFPHNLRKLFARTFYKAEKDISKLADILGHSSMDTTRIYVMTTEVEHRAKIEHLGLVT